MRSIEPLTIGGGELEGDAGWLAAFWAAQSSPLVRNMLATAGDFAMSDLGARIVGERGSGRLQLAKLIHSKSSRAECTFHHVPCGALGDGEADELLFGSGETAGGGEGPGLIETARGGTIYLNDFYALPEETRFRLWKVMELKHLRRAGRAEDVAVDIRIIAGVTKYPAFPGEYATADPESARKIGPICINIPPLRERREDIEALIYLFLSENYAINGKTVTGITSRALDLCRYYDWPGNIYELRTVIHHSAVRCGGGEIDVADLPEFLCQVKVPRQAVPEQKT